MISGERRGLGSGLYFAAAGSLFGDDDETSGVGVEGAPA